MQGDNQLGNQLLGSDMCGSEDLRKINPSHGLGSDDGIHEEEIVKAEPVTRDSFTRDSFSKRSSSFKHQKSMTQKDNEESLTLRAQNTVKDN
jgi:hypothetical protein